MDIARKQDTTPQGTRDTHRTLGRAVEQLNRRARSFRSSKEIAPYLTDHRASGLARITQTSRDTH